jgi:putative DNA primase/helicase
MARKQTGRAHRGDDAAALRASIGDESRASIPQPISHQDQQPGNTGRPNGKTSNAGEDDDLGTILFRRLAEQAAEQEKKIGELAGKSALDYDRERKPTAKKLGVRVSTLDKTVAVRRRKVDEEKIEAALFEHWACKLWSRPIVTERLLGAIEDRIKKHVVMGDDAAVVVTLWVAFTWVHDEAIHSPILMVTSAEPDSGKSTLLGLISFLVKRSLSSVGISPAALYRSIDKWCPTLIVDEADALFSDSEDLRQAVNSGWTRGQGVVRCVGDDNDPKPFSTFCPKAIGLKGRNVPDTLLSRSIVIEMQRKLLEESIFDFRHVDDAELKELRSRLARWATDHLKTHRPEPAVPPGFRNRLAANWRPLLAIADAAGGSWPERARRAAVTIGSTKSARSLGLLLLEDIKTVFDRLGVEKLHSEVIIKELCTDAEAPWAEFRGGKELSQKQLANLLRPFGVHSDPLWVGTVCRRGYARASFEQLWKRYLGGVEA